MFRSARLFSLIAVLGLVATACGSSGAPATYGEQPGEFESVNGDVEEVGLLERNYREACETAETELELFANPSDVAQYCNCTFGKYEEQVPEVVFKAFSDKIGERVDDINSPEDLQLVYREAVESVDPEDLDGEEPPADILELIENLVNIE